MRTIDAPENFMSKKSAFDAGAIRWEAAGEVWFEALCDFVAELQEHVEKAEKDQLRFQDGRLFRSLIRHVKARASGKDEWRLRFVCYEFATNTLQCSGYREALRLHNEEMRARGLFSAREFCLSLPERFAVAPEPGMLKELLAYVRSIAWWMEAQVSFSLWLVFKDLRPAWGSDRAAREHAIQAAILSALPQKFLTRTMHRGREVLSARFPEEARIGTNWDNKPWDQGKWKSILLQAAGLTKKRYDCTELEKWVWWCYPVFQRYRWNAREVLDAASKRGIDFEKEKKGIDQLIKFQKYWIRRGLRFVGGKQKQDRTPPLLEFVVRVVLPDPGKMWGDRGGFLFLPKKN
jgi:hypothetical protein